MPIDYLALKRQIALRSAQIIGSSQATLESAYAGAFASALDGAEVPISAIKDLVLMIEKELVHIIGSDASHPYRTFLYSASAPLTDLASTPADDADGVEFFGVFDAVSDASDNRPCTLVPTQTIADIVDGAPAFFDPTTYYYYNINGNFIRTTQTSVILQGCSWSQTLQETEYDADGSSPLPAMLANTMIAGTLGSLPQIGWSDSTGTCAMYSNLYQQGIGLLQMGNSSSIPLASQQNAASG